MKVAIQAIVFLLVSVSLYAQENKNLELVANVQFPGDGNDIWGYVDSTGTEYAIIGTTTGTRIYSLEDPTSPVERAFVPGATSIWRDIKSYNDHLYITTDDFQNGETADGLTIVDMSMAPDSISFTRWQPFVDFGGISGQLGECHNLYIDTEEGFCYLAGCQGVGREGVIVLDLNQDPKEPVITSIINDAYSHDVYVNDGKLYASNILAGRLYIHDITDKAAPVLLGTQSTTSFFTHNAWASDDNKYVFTTDERARGRVDSYDVSDPENIQRLDNFRPADRFADNAIPHNVHYHNGFVVTSWYTEGVVVIDANRPENMVKVASYDTYTDEATIPQGEADRWFYGLWGAYPYLPSGLLLGSDINTGLYIWRPVQETTGLGEEGYVRACYLEGQVTDANSGSNIIGATVRILSDDVNTKNSGGMGIYRTGQLTPGTFEVAFSHPNYDDLILEATLVNGEVTILDAQMQSTLLTVNTRRMEDGAIVPFTRIIVENVETGFRTDEISNQSGVLRTALKSGQTYRLLCAKWGYRGLLVDEVGSDGEPITLTIELETGYEDDFFADLGWQVESTAETGAWQRGIPNDLVFDGAPSQTSQDIPDDIGDLCWATGLSGTSAGDNDIDSGATTVRSPRMDLRGYDQVEISYSLWFVNGGGQGNPTPDDEVSVILASKDEELVLEGLSTSTPAWTRISNTVSRSDIEFTDSMVIYFRANDEGEGHIAEAQFDAFLVEGDIVNSSDDVRAVEVAVSPNPAKDHVTVTYAGDLGKGVRYQIYSTTGQLVESDKLTGELTRIETERWGPSGIYFIHIQSADGGTVVEKIAKL